MSRLVVDITAPSRGPDEVVLEVNDHRFSGWEDIEVTLRAEAFPNSFSVALSSKDPTASIPAKAGDPVQVYLGDDTVIDGYIDRVVESGSSSPAGAEHIIAISGRGKTQDLVDCSGEWGSGAMTNVTVLDVATKLAGKYGIAVKVAEGADVGSPIDQIAVTFTETGAEQIQRLARNAGLMAYEDSTGALVLSVVGTTTAASGIAYWKNVQRWSVENSMDGRYSDITCLQQAQDTTIELGDEGEFVFNVNDASMPRHRLIYVIMDQQSDNPEEFTRRKTNWEMSRRIGRSVVASATVDSWRDSKDKLWTPNTLVPVSLPGMVIDDTNLCLSEVTFRRSSEAGTTADLVLMPKAAFSPAPIVLIPANFLGIDQVSPAS